jgi:hypothetical protein
MDEDGNMRTSAELDPTVTASDFTYLMAAEAMSFLQDMVRQELGDDAVEKVGEVRPATKVRKTRQDLN